MKIKTVKRLPKLLFNKDIMDLCLRLVSAFSSKDDWKVLQRYSCAT